MCLQLGSAVTYVQLMFWLLAATAMGQGSGSWGRCHSKLMGGGRLEEKEWIKCCGGNSEQPVAVGTVTGWAAGTSLEMERQHLRV